MYIRTKIGIYYKDNEKIVEIGKKKSAVKIYLGKNVYNNTTYEQIIAESEKIEELCDRFVFIDKKYQRGKYRYQVYTRLFEKKNLPKYIQNGIEIYGAIWTDKGLIYVAKLNDKGELELI